MRRTVIISVIGVFLLGGCASSYYADYQARHPEWIPAFPDSEANLEQTVASLYAPPPIGTQTMLRKLEILRTDLTPWQPISLAELRSGQFESSPDHDYAVIADIICRSRVAFESFQGEKIATYLLPRNRLTALDHFDFVEGCTVSNAFVPARGELITVERAVGEHVQRNYPASMFHASEAYRRGVALARSGRVDDARAMLALADEKMDVSGERPRFETPGIDLRVADESTAHSEREGLLRAISASEPATAVVSGSDQPTAEPRAEVR